MLLDYHIHAAAHGEYRYDYEWLKSFLDTARRQGIKEVGFAEHDEFVQLIDAKVLAGLRGEYDDVRIRLGLEVDFIPGREPEIAALRNKYDWDYFIGSIHFIDGWGFDHPDYGYLFEKKDYDQVYEEYFSLVNRMALSGLFDVVGHLDLIKIWGHRPWRQSTLAYAKPVLHSIKGADGNRNK
ncbi:PHP domain-containing protein [Syntrophomonas palmitatica]|uniref:PHP domain-containing protein n=1 Tax=Syntrophomonas palmitatica TaxID=402877 RepID=UPI0006D206F6|nr:PHP domain-containing protein [Syntrophomonas palmitatica]